MIITCEQCRARFKLADEKLKAEGTKVRCSKCQSIFTVFPPPPAPVEPADREVGAEPANNTATVFPASKPAPEAIPEPEPAPSAALSEALAPPAADASSDFDFGIPDTSPAGASEDEAFSFAASAAPADAEEPAAPGIDRAAITGPVEFDFDDAFAEQTAAPADEAAPAAGAAEFDFGMTPATAAPDTESSFTAADELDFPEETLSTTPPSEFDFTEDVPGTTPPGEFDFTEETPGEISPGEFNFTEEAPGETSPAEFAFNEGTPDDAPSGDFDFGTAPAPGESPGFDFAEGPAAAPDDEFRPDAPADQGTPPTAAAGFGEVSFDDESDEGFSFGTDAGTETTGFGDSDDSWGEPEAPALDSFNFEEPKFESQSKGSAPPSQPAELSFGEIDFSDGDEAGETFPSFDSEPNFARPAPPAEPPAPAPAPAPVAAPPMQRVPVNRPRSEEPLPLPARRRSPVSTMVITLVVLLVVLCGAGGYLYMSGDGERLIGQLVMKIKGEKPVGPVEQLIGLNISGSSYVNNREAGQLLVVQGTAANNFTTTRSAIAVKGLLLDAAGKTIQQQTVFCGNPLSEEKLRTLKYAEIEEAMNNQFGDSLTNMNVKPGTSIPFTVVFRNIPKEMANINVEIVDSKPGGG